MVEILLPSAIAAGDGDNDNQKSPKGSLKQCETKKPPYWLLHKQLHLAPSIVLH